VRVHSGTIALGAIAAAAALLQTLHALQGEIVVDIWEHAAVVRELAARPWWPTHPQLALDAPHAFFSPYHLALALVSRGFGPAPLTVLTAAGIGNVALVAFALRRLMVRLSPVGAQAAPYALLFVFFFWGRKPWLWSGFLHVEALVYVAPYASTFAAGVLLLALSVAMDALERPSPRLFSALALLVALCLLAHPTTAAALIASLSALFASRTRANLRRQAVGLAVAVLAGGLLSLAWPYFSIRDLLTTQAAEFNAESRMLYEGVARRIWPALTFLPVLAARWHHDRRDPLALLVLALAAVYAFGWLSGATGLGRILAWLVMAVHLAAAIGFVELARRLDGGRRLALHALALVALLLMVALHRGPLLRAWQPGPQPWRALAGVLAPVAERDVVLADMTTSWMVPALAGRVVASSHPLYWVPDHAARRAAVAAFFDPATSDGARRRIAAQIGARWLVVSGELRPEERARLMALGTVHAESGPYTLVEIAPSPPDNPLTP
jgi:hypothetical protein